MQANNRKALSLRVPADIAEKIEAYATENGLSKTDAYVHFLRAGLSYDATTDHAALASIDAKIDEVVEMLCTVSSRLELPPLSQQNVLDAIRKVSAGYPSIKRAWLFGSYSRNQQGPESDIDVRLDIDEELKFTLSDLVSFSEVLEATTGRECDVITSRALKNKMLAEAIERDKVLAYERKEERSLPNN